MRSQIDVSQEGAALAEQLCLSPGELDYSPSFEGYLQTAAEPRLDSLDMLEADQLGSVRSDKQFGRKTTFEPSQGTPDDRRCIGEPDRCVGAQRLGSYDNWSLLGQF